MSNFLSSPEAGPCAMHTTALSRHLGALFLPSPTRNSLPLRPDLPMRSRTFAAGRLTRPELALIVIALVVLIVVIIVH